MDALQMGIAVYGSKPVATGAGVKTFSKNAYAYETDEDTTIASFRDAAGAAVTTGWEGIVISAHKTIYFGASNPIKSFTVTTGGKGQVFLSE